MTMTRASHEVLFIESRWQRLHSSNYKCLLIFIMLLSILSSLLSWILLPTASNSFLEFIGYALQSIYFIIGLSCFFQLSYLAQLPTKMPSQPIFSWWEALEKTLSNGWHQSFVALQPIKKPLQTETSSRIVQETTTLTPIRRRRNTFNNELKSPPAYPPSVSKIETPQQLDTYLSTHNNTSLNNSQTATEDEDSMVFTASNTSSNYAMMDVVTSSPGPYMVMPKTEIVGGSPSYGTIEDRREDGWSGIPVEPDFNAAMDTLENYGIMTSFHDYSDNVRRMLGRLLQDFIQAFERNASELTDCGILREVLDRELLIQPIFRAPGTSYSRARVSLSDMFVCFAREPLFQSQSRPGVNLLTEHQRFGGYFSVSENNHAYTLYRLRCLAQDGLLSNVRWDSGVVYKGTEWKADERPSDAEILINVFCAMMDALLPPSYEGDRPFRRLHFDTCFANSTTTMSTPHHQSSIRGRFLIVQTVHHPPHFKVIANGKLCEVLPGKNNWSNVIVLFLSAVQRQKSGHLGNINLHHILEQVFDTF